MIGPQNRGKRCENRDQAFSRALIMYPSKIIRWTQITTFGYKIIFFFAILNRDSRREHRDHVFCRALHVLRPNVWLRSQLLSNSNRAAKYDVKLSPPNLIFTLENFTPRGKCSWEKKWVKMLSVGNRHQDWNVVHPQFLREVCVCVGVKNNQN